MDRCPATCNSTCVKLYLCSNPEDSIVERRALRECVFPKLREHCRDTLGLDVRVIDPFESRDPSHWPDENTRRQLIVECRESSAGPFLLALIGHQYGAASLPAQVEVSEYLRLQQEGLRVGVSTQELDRVYQRDENTVPPSYCLRPLHRHTCRSQSDVVEEEEEVKMKTKEEKLMQVFQTTVTLSVHNGGMTPEKAHRYYRSALDADLRFSLDDCSYDDIARRCLVYVHKVVNAIGEREKDEINSQLQLPSQVKVAASHLRTKPTDGQLLSELCDNFLPALISSCQLLVYTTTTECDRRHGYTTARRRSYAESLCQQVYSDLVGLVDRWNVSENRPGTHPGDALAREQAEQEELCEVLSRFYDIIQPEEEKVRAYVEHRDQQCPLVVTGGPCTGKKVLLAHCAQQIKSWLPDISPMVITHFCSLSISNFPQQLLSSLCYQIYNRFHSSSKQSPSLYRCTDPNEPSCPRDQKPSCKAAAALESHLEPITRAHGSDFTLNLNAMSCPHPKDTSSGLINPDVSLSELKERLCSLLTLLPSPKQPVVLILDGLDQNEKTFSLPIIESLPSPLPPCVKLIFTISPNNSHVLQAIKQHYPQCSLSRCLSEDSEKKDEGYICVQVVPNRKGCMKMLAWLLTSSGRKVTSGQQALVNRALTSCCLTLYARLLHVHSSLWKSDSDVTESSLPDGVHSSISALLDHLEQKHGSSVVTRAVSYLTLSRTGLTEAELADLLSCDDQVSVENVQQCETALSTVRVLQIDLERLLLDLRSFLIQRTVAGSRVLLWVSRHFKLVVAKRYLDTHEVRTKIHSEMADYFSGRWACGNAKPLSLKEEDSPQICIDPLPSSQPFVSTSLPTDVGRVNLRKVVELPYHLQLSNRWEELEQRLLMSFRFHQAMVQAGLLGDLVAMLEHEDESCQFVFSREKLLLARIFRSSACLLQHTPLLLSSTIETSLLSYLEVFPALKDYVREIRHETRERRSGLRVVLSPAPSSVPSIQSLQVNAKDVSVAVAAGTDCGIVAEIMDDGSAWVWKNSQRDLLQLSLSCEQKEFKFSGVKSSGRFMLLSTHCNKLFLWDVTGPEVFLEIKYALKKEFESSLHKPNKIAGFVTYQEKLFVWWENESLVCVFDVSRKTLAHLQCQSCVTCLVCSTNGLYVYCGQEDGSVSIFDIETSTLLGTCSNSSHSAVTLIIIGEYKGEMACVNKMGNITLWDVAAKTQQPRLVKERFSGGKSNKILNIDYSEENDMLLLCQSHQVTLWDVCDWVIMDQFLSPQDKAFTQAMLSQDGHLFLALLDQCALVLVWRLDTGQCVLSLETHKQPHTLLKMPSDVICVTHGGCLTAWDYQMIALAGTAPKMRRGVRVVVEQRGERFYTTDGSQAVWKWSLDTGFPHANFLHDGPVEKLCLSPNGVQLVSLSAGELYIWLTETGENTLRISGSRTTDILITPNSNFGVSISKPGLSRVWKLTHGSIVCSIHLHLSEAQVSPESTFLIGLHRGDLLAASLWSGSISKRFSCVESSERVVAFQTLLEHPDFVVVMAASGSVFTWKMAEETVCRHFRLPYMFHCQPQDFQMSSDGSYALLSTHNEAINILDLHQIRLCSFKAEGPVITAHLNKTGGYAAYISGPTCHLHTKPILTVVRLADGERLGSVYLCKNPSALVCERQCVFVGFEDGSVGVYSVSDVMTTTEETIGCRQSSNNRLKQCPFDRAPFSWFSLPSPNVTWP
ncbi:hypothetical protein Q5P01_010135 [Channa striata]|uniref:NWD1/2-like winged helix-turn-helix domain-containing protein n=1 Tax=Channa striata TaxID=64152 RepID=A0AA88SVC0_CHASR|nr:hypothetical protein Q5P01_010135 [Channa striata]